LKGVNHSLVTIDKDHNMFSDEENTKLKVDHTVSSDQLKFIFLSNGQVKGIGSTTSMALIGLDYNTNVPNYVPLHAISNPGCIRAVNRYESTLGFIYPMMLTRQPLRYHSTTSPSGHFVCSICGKKVITNDKKCIYLAHSGKKVGHYVDASCKEEPNGSKMLVGEKWSCCNLYSSELGCVMGCHIQQE
jgi:hypothetical protein